MVLSATRDQAGNLFNLIKGGFAASPALKGLVENETADTLRLSSRIDIVVRPASFRSTRGGTCIGVVTDELAFWRTDDSANPDIEILRALRPSLATIGGPLIAISSPYAKRGELWKAHRRHHGNDDSPVLCIQAASQVMNPSLDPAFIKAQFADDPEAARAEYGAEFRGDIASFISREAVEECVEPGLRERAPISTILYHGFCDPSGGSADAMTLAISHRERDSIVLDAMRERKPPFSPEAVVSEFAALLRAYRLGTVAGDRYAGEWPREVFRRHGVEYRVAGKSRSELYLALLPLINSRRVDLLDNATLVLQLANLERRTVRSGRDSIDHAPGAHDDLANAAAGALVAAVEGKRRMIISDQLLRDTRVMAPVCMAFQ